MAYLKRRRSQLRLVGYPISFGIPFRGDEIEGVLASIIYINAVSILDLACKCVLPDQGEPDPGGLKKRLKALQKLKRLLDHKELKRISRRRNDFAHESKDATAEELKAAYDAIPTAACRVGTCYWRTSAPGTLCSGTGKMTRRVKLPWTAERIPGGYVVKDATGNNDVDGQDGLNVPRTIIKHALKFMLARSLRGTTRLSTLFGSNELTASTSYGSRFRLRLGDYIDRIVLQQGYYESKVLEALRRDLPSGAVVWDVGANFGLHAITLRVLRPDIHVICFEPSPDLTTRITENARLNNVTIEVHCIGLGGETL
jgi:hypothetical protein